MNKLSNRSRLITAFVALAMISVLFVPFWSIYLIAPQYPEGLSMQIWLYQITGQVEIINGLNHYIGMKHIKAEMFPEFQFLPWVFGGYILFGFIVAVSGNRKLLLSYLILFLIGGIAALADFYKWGYDYGHDLDPNAAIQVPGLTYQPPVIGHKKLLNFDAFSYPDTGAWIVIVAVGLLFIIWLIERKKKNYTTVSSTATRKLNTIVTASMVLLLGGCKPEAEKIVVGTDVCAECKMTIMDDRFGGEIVTKKGKVYKFDDAHCIALFMEKRTVELPHIHQTLFVDYERPGELIEVKKAEFVLSSQLKSPMGGNAAAFQGKEAAEKKSATLAGSKVTNWATLYNILIK